MKIIKPEKLKKGDTIGILAVSGRIKEFKNILNAKNFFENNGYRVVISPTCKSSHRYMAGNSDEECINTLHDFFSDKSINAILCARGGFGTLRLINKIDWEIIKNNPKIFAGYSDITTLLTLIYKNCGLITFHSAMANGDFGNEINEYTANSFFSALNGCRKEYKSEYLKCFRSGEAEGTLWGGNLATLASLCGSDFIPDEDLILFLEDLNEPVYKIDKMLTQLFNIKKMRNNVKGIVLGEFRDIDNIEWFDDVISELAEELNIPVGGGFRITHGTTKDTLPVGVRGCFCSSKGIVNLSEDYIV